ncbi:MAG: DUF4398 and OmpA-like domain-containing protein [Rubrivivax sp.]|nr:DUF4398 and OmpA-like domain-containing protein [Rubrivivax sp.]
MKHPTFLVLPVALAALTFAACTTLPERNLALDQARSRLDAAQSDPLVTLHAGEELTRAGSAVQLAAQAQLDGRSRDEVDHLAYLGERQVTVARETADSRAAQAITASASAERERLLVTRREQEAQALRRQLATSEQLGLQQGAELARAERDASQGRAELARSDARVDVLEQQLLAMDARRTERGMVVTLGDMLFDSGQSRLQAGGAHSLVKLAEFMRSRPQRRAVIEGYTDDLGDDAGNQMLSDRRARSVKAALVDMGVAADRLSTFGHGARNPAASNDTVAGRQANRRVEIVFPPGAGSMPAR